MLESVRQRLPRQVRHHVVHQPVGLARVVKREDVRVMEPRGDTDLVEEAFRADCGRDLGMQHLERHLTVVLELVREEDARHPAAPDAPQIRVATLQGIAQALENGIANGDKLGRERPA